jgi:hypothetical protein
VNAPLADERVVFRHSFFEKLQDLYFRVSEQSGEAVGMVRLGDNEVALPLRGIRKELKLAEDDPDARMLDLIGDGLQYVRFLRPGDPLPRELTTREASWEPGERHKMIAHQRLTIQLVSWLSGEERVLTNPDELQQVADDPATRKRVVTAFDEAAEKLGLGRERKHEVVDHLERLTVELSYIEALRDLFQAIKGMESKIQGLRKLYGHERSVLEVADPVARLMAVAVKELGEFFMQVDAQTCEIMGLLRNIDNHTAYIRMVRDELHKRMMAWDQILSQWARVKVAVDTDKPELLRDTYHFLAPRYMQVNEWILVTKLHEKEREPQGVSLMGASGGQKKIKFAKGMMEW